MTLFNARFIVFKEEEEEKNDSKKVFLIEFVVLV